VSNIMREPFLFGMLLDTLALNPEIEVELDQINGWFQEEARSAAGTVCEIATN